MNTRCEEQNLNLAEVYYGALLSKDFNKMSNCLHEEVDFVGPLAAIKGKEHVVLAAKNLSNLIKDIHIRAKFSAQNQIMFAYDFLFPKPIGCLRAAVLMNFTDNLISKIELFYDGAPFLESANKIFKDKKS